MQQLGWIDIHTHLNMLEESPQEAINLAKKNGVERLITIGTCPEDHPVVLGLAEEYFPQVYCTLGVHPHDASAYTPEVELYIREKALQKEVVAIGEIGLDYYYKKSPIEQQQQAFRSQLQIAADLALPIEIHTRDAEEDTIALLSEFRGQLSGVVHCFTGTQFLADAALDLGLNISISGVVTFKNADQLRAVVKTIPLDRLHVETDAPFLAPIPQRGKKNTPAFIVYTAEKVAEIKGIELEELARVTKQNAMKVFTKLSW